MAWACAISIPELLIALVRGAGARALTIATNNVGLDDCSLGLLQQMRQVKKMISSYVGEYAEFMYQRLSGEPALELASQVTLA